ncbi:MAG: recombinase family protein, partial [bacterium]
MKKEESESLQQKPCAIYVRVSTQKQAEEGMSIESQIETLKHEAARRGKPVFEVYNDAGVSGGASNRPEFMRMLKDSQQKPPPFDLVLTWSISRFGRNTMESYIATEKMRERGITIFYHKEPFNDEDPVGAMVIQILRAVAEFSRLEYVKDVERSKGLLARNGYSTGGPPPFGLRRLEVVDNGKRHVRWEPDPDTAPIARKIFEMYADGYGYKTICRWLNDQGLLTIRGNKWRSSAFSRMLRNEAYIGNVVYNKEVKRGAIRNGGAFKHKPEDKWIRCDNIIEPIVPRDVFDRVQLKLRSNNISEALAKNSQYLLSGLLKCSVCGNPYFGQTAERRVGGKSYVYTRYLCSKQNRYNEKRDNVNLKRDWFDDLIVNRLFERILSETNIMERITNEAEEIEQAVKERTRQIEGLKKEKQRVEALLTKYYEAFESGSLSPEELKSRMKGHQGRADELALEIMNLQNEIAFCKARQGSGIATLLKVDFKHLRGMFDSL